jgi:hypothetical protein
MLKLHFALLFAIISLASLGWAQPPQATAPSDETTRLIRDLGSPLFEQREIASAELLRLGESALPALEQGLESADAEIGFRCEKLIALIRKGTEEKRLREFVQSGLKAGEKAKPNWERFQKLIDGDSNTQALFIELFEHDPAFLKLAIETPERVPAWAETRRRELTGEAFLLLQAGQDPVLIRPKVRMAVKQALALPNPDLDMLDQTYLFGKTSGCDDDPVIMGIYRLRLSEQFVLLAERREIDTNEILRLINLSKSLKMENEFKDAVRPVAAAAIERVLSSPYDKKDRSEAYGLIRLAESCDIQGIAPLAVKVGLTKEFDAKTRARAINLVGKYGSKEQIEPLSPLLGDRTELWKFGQISVDGVGYSSYLGDVALAVMVRLSGENPADYGCDDIPIFSGAGYFGPSEEAIEEVRKNSLQKWLAR